MTSYHVESDHVSRTKSGSSTGAAARASKCLTSLYNTNLKVQSTRHLPIESHQAVLVIGVQALLQCTLRSHLM